MNMSGRSKASNVLGGKTARACDSCLVKRARWFCAADDAFLCQSCDAAVHSANQLASRHERVRLEASSCKPSPAAAPAWHQGFTKKARTPRHGAKSSSRSANHHRHQQQPPLVPEMGSDDPFPEENDEELFLCRVPEFDDEYFRTEMVKGEEEEGFGMMSMVFDDDDDRELNLEELLMSSCDDEFAVDVESLLGMEKVEKVEGDAIDETRVKLEEKEEDNDVDDEIACHFDPALDAELNWDFDCTMSEDVVREGEDMVKNDNIEMESNESSQLLVSNNDDKRNKLLRLNYEAVMAAWATRSSNSPWTDGIRPQHFDLDEFMGASWMDEWGGRRWRGKDAAGREARVSRYREKRRTRLFSKKIRYEVRKLNAEKRPRMKGRFVKRTTFLGSSSLPYHLINQKS